ncbi:uncharacterized protein METZ01_LOCUS481997, partial [marine metagenome]
MTRANKKMFNQAVCKIQEAIWSGEYGIITRGAKSRKKNPHHPLDGTKWPLFRVNDLSSHSSPDWWSPSISWDRVSLKKIKAVTINQPRRQIWSGTGREEGKDRRKIDPA